ncbi:MAG: hypothetical protein Q9167_006619 [Letrouitia subvulpina]
MNNNTRGHPNDVNLEASLFQFSSLQPNLKPFEKQEKPNQSKSRDLNRTSKMLTKEKFGSINDDQVPTYSKPSRASTSVHTPPKDKDKDFAKPTTYNVLQRTQLRRKSLRNDIKTLLNQYLDTMAFLTRLCPRRMFPPLDFEIVHLHTSPHLTIFYLLLFAGTTLGNLTPAIFPIKPGIWEVIIDRSNPAILQQTAFLHLRIPTEPPKGIVARAAQCRTGVDPRDRYVSKIYIEVIERFPWRQIVEDAARAFTILHPTMARIGTSFYDFAPYDDRASTSKTGRDQPTWNIKRS